MEAIEPVPTELYFLADIYAGWNNSTMSAKQFNEIVKAIKNFPAKHLAKRINNSNLNALRKTLFDANLQDELLLILKRKYFPQLCYRRSKISANELLCDMDLPSEIANVIRKAWKANGHSGEKMVIKSSPILEQEASELLDETEFDSNMSAESCDVKNDTVSEGGTPPELTECHMLSSNIDQDNKLSSFLDAVENGKKLTDENWLRFLGITEKQLKHILEPIAEHILSLFCYLNSGQVLKKLQL